MIKRLDVFLMSLILSKDLILQIVLTTYNFVKVIWLC